MRSPSANTRIRASPRAKLGPKRAEHKASVRFKDGKRTIDYVLVVQPYETSNVRRFIKNLQKLGLQFEVAAGRTTNLRFIKVHMPDAALDHFAQVYDLTPEEHVEIGTPTYRHPFTTPVSSIPQRKKGEYSSAERIMITNKVLESTRYGPDPKEYGMNKLMRLKYLVAAYPLHDGPWTDVLEPNNTDVEKSTDRYLLATYMANMDMWYKELPLDLIFRYFGAEVAFYFAWLEYFIIMLLAPSIIGSLQFLFSLFVVTFWELPEVEEVCTAPESMKLCSLCNRKCFFLNVRTACETTIWSAVFDNTSTVIFAVAMSFWFTLFITLWKRKESKLKMRWKLDFEDIDTDIRLEYKEKTKTVRVNVYSGDLEPYTTRTQKGLKMAFTILAITFMLFIVMVEIVASIYFKLYLMRWLVNSGVKFLKKSSKGLMMAIGSIIQVMFMKLYSKVYRPFSMWLTKFELPRTQQEFDISVLYKKFILAFTNNYSGMFYMAFMKGTFFTTPHKEKFEIYERDVCQPNTCVVPLCVQLAFIMTLKTFAGNIWTLTTSSLKKKRKQAVKKNVEGGDTPEWEEQYYLEPTTRFFVTTEFLEMIMRVGFVTFFVAAFPLAPLCAFLNNLIELRSDAYKMLRFCRRPVPLKRSGIGPWNGILLGMMYVSTVTNAFLIAFTSDWVPRVVHYSEHGTLKGFVNSTMTEYHVEDYATPEREFPKDLHSCFYRGKRYSAHSESDVAHRFTRVFWIDLMWRFVVVFLFEHVIFLFNTILSYAIPKVPLSVRLQLNLDRQLAKEAKLNAGGKDGNDRSKSKLKQRVREASNKGTQVTKRRQVQFRDESREMVGTGPITAYL